MQNSANRKFELSSIIKHHIRWLLPLVWAGSILWLSLTPSPPQMSGFLSWDKLQHAGAYALLTILVAQCLFILIDRPWRAGIWAALLSITYGGILEILQLSMQAGRSAEWLDLVADMTGALVGCVIFRQIAMFICSRSRMKS